MKTPTNTDELDEMRARAISAMYGQWSWANPELQAGFFDIARTIRLADAKAGVQAVPVKLTSAMVSRGYYSCTINLPRQSYPAMVTVSPFYTEPPAPEPTQPDLPCGDECIGPLCNDCDKLP